MKPREMLVICGGHLVTPYDSYNPGMLLVCGERIVYAGPEGGAPVPADACVVDCRGAIVAPGLIDIHTHGAGGVLFGLARSVGDIKAACNSLVLSGVTSCFATVGSLGPMDEQSLERAVELVRESTGTAVLGLNFEGPFLSAARAGVSKAWASSERASVDGFCRLLHKAKGIARMVTIAPEVDGAHQVLSACRDVGAKVSLGHTDATYDVAMEFIRKGASHATHTFNAMRSLHHREPGVVMATLRSPQVTNEVIADGVHVHPSVLWLVLKAKPRENVVLVTDGSGLTGLPDGAYEMPGGTRVIVADNKCTLSDGTIAGSVMPANMQIALLVRECGLNTAHAISLMTANPALEFGLMDKGVLAPGKDADILILNDDFSVRQVYVRGKAAM